MDFYDGNINSSTSLKLNFSVIHRKKVVRTLSEHFKVLSNNFFWGFMSEINLDKPVTSIPKEFYHPAFLKGSPSPCCMHSASHSSLPSPSLQEVKCFSLRALCHSRYLHGKKDIFFKEISALKINK